MKKTNAQFNSPMGLNNAPLRETGLGTGSIRPEWLRLPKPGTACHYTGLTRTPMYGLIREGKVRSVVLRQRGKLRGIRLIDYASLIQFLRELDTEQNSSLRPPNKAEDQTSI